MSGLRLQEINKSFGAVDVLKNVNLEIEDGEFVVFVGPSGCGKSTLLRVISGLEETTSGSVHIGDEDVTDHDPSDRGVSMVFQSYALYPHMNVAQNLGFGLRMGGMDKDEIASRVKEAARILDIGAFLDRKPKALSGGQRQRVAIGRAIVRQPNVFLFDEPLSNLDAELRTQTRLEIARLHQELGATMVFVTHDQVEAMTLADKIVVLRDGKVEQVGAPMDLYDDPNNAFVASFIGSPKMNMMPATLTETGTEFAKVTVPALGDQVLTVGTRANINLSSGDAVTLGVRPEHFVDVDSSRVVFQGEVQVVEQLGGVSYVHAIGKNDAPMIIQQQGRFSMPNGSKTEFAVDEAACFLFGEDGRRL